MLGSGRRGLTPRTSTVSTAFIGCGDALMQLSTYCSCAQRKRWSIASSRRYAMRSAGAAAASSRASSRVPVELASSS
jgi:hypothetical protein